METALAIFLVAFVAAHAAQLNVKPSNLGSEKEMKSNYLLQKPSISIGSQQDQVKLTGLNQHGQLSRDEVFHQADKLPRSYPSRHQLLLSSDTRNSIDEAQMLQNSQPINAPAIMSTVHSQVNDDANKISFRHQISHEIPSRLPQHYSNVREDEKENPARQYQKQRDQQAVNVRHPQYESQPDTSFQTLYSNPQQIQGRELRNNQHQMWNEQINNGQRQQQDYDSMGQYDSQNQNIDDVARQQFYANEQDRHLHQQQAVSNNQQELFNVPQQEPGNHQVMAINEKLGQDMTANSFGGQLRRFENGYNQGDRKQDIGALPELESARPQVNMRTSAFGSGRQPVVFPRETIFPSSMLASGFKNMPMLPALVYSAGPAASVHATVFSKNSYLKGGASLRQYLQTPFVQYVYGHLL